MENEKNTLSPGDSKSADITNNIDSREQVPVGIIGGDKIDGDKITIGATEEQAAVAVGRGAKASVFNVDIRLLPLVIGLGLLLAILAYFQFRPPELPQSMDSGFNVAVAEFMVVDEAGNQIKSDEGLTFANWLYERVEEGLRIELLKEQFTDTLHVWMPEYTGVISGADKEEREKNAKMRASDIGADVIIYGVLEQAETESDTAIEFYVNHESFEEGQDIKGHHELGSPVRISNPFETGLDILKNTPLTTRANSLSLLAIGLAYYSVDDFDSAIKYLEQANSDEAWGNYKADGKHVVKMLLGNAHARKASIEIDPAVLPTAQSYYAEALVIDPVYARATIGMASVNYMLALGKPDDLEEIDLELLEKAEAGFETAATLKEKGDPANVQSKADYGLGNVFMMRYQVEGGDWLDKSVEKFEKVTTHFENGNKDIKDLAAHAYGRMGFIEDVYRQKPQSAIANYDKAAELASPFYKGVYFSRLGDLYEEICDLDLADDAYEDAYFAAKQISKHAQADEYSRKRNALSEVEVCS